MTRQQARDFKFRLCLALGWPHPDYLDLELSTKQMLEWQDYYCREPWGFPIEDTRSAMQQLIAARVGGSKTAELADFQLAQTFRDGPPNEDGTPNETTLQRRLFEMLNPKPVDEVKEADNGEAGITHRRPAGEHGGAEEGS